MTPMVRTMERGIFIPVRSMKINQSLITDRSTKIRGVGAVDCSIMNLLDGKSICFPGLKAILISHKEPWTGRRSDLPVSNKMCTVLKSHFSSKRPRHKFHRHAILENIRFENPLCIHELWLSFSVLEWSPSNRFLFNFEHSWVDPVEIGNSFVRDFGTRTMLFPQTRLEVGWYLECFITWRISCNVKSGFHSSMNSANVFHCHCFTRSPRRPQTGKKDSSKTNETTYISHRAGTSSPFLPVQVRHFILPTSRASFTIAIKQSRGHERVVAHKPRFIHPKGQHSSAINPSGDPFSWM